MLTVTGVLAAAWLLLVVVAGTWGCAGGSDTGGTSSGFFLAQLPWEVRDRLLLLQPDLNVSRLTGAPVPLYRPDLGDQIAYWLISYNHHEYAILSAGQHTGDSRLVMQAEAPCPLTSLRRQALTLHNSTCDKFFVLTPAPELNLACDTPQGHRLTSTPLAPDLNVSSLWEEMMKEKQHYDNNNMGHHAEDNTTLHFFVISASQPASFPMTGMRDCHIRSLGQSDGSDVSVQLLCELLGGVCDDLGRVHVHQTTEYGEVYVHLKPVAEDRHSRFQHDLHFEMVGHHTASGIITKRFALEPFHRAKRSTSYTYYSINEKHRMPDYNQFKRGRCQVGCGPVAWAQIFGYFDRRAHFGSGSSASQALYKCGDDGTTGTNACMAPMYNDDRMKKYIGKLNDILKTFCLFGSGATTQKNMDKVEGFFRQRQGSSGDVILKTRSFFLSRLLGINSNSIRDSALSYVRQRWPVIVGFRVSGFFSQHYAVMTQYRTRTVRKKTCFLWIFCRTYNEREYDMYLHMGWGGSSNGWRKAVMYMAAVAKY